MKKILSVLLSICMIITMSATSVAISYATDASAESTSGVGDAVSEPETSGVDVSDAGDGVVEEPKFTFTTDDSGNVTITGYSGSGDIVIPSKIDGKSVTTIKFSAFLDRKDISSLVISKGIENIQFSAFEGCTALTSVILPEGIKSIGQRAFRGCTSLTSITIPSSVETLDNQAFGSCSSLEKVIFKSPTPPKTFNDLAFYFIKKFAIAYVPAGSIGYDELGTFQQHYLTLSLDVKVLPGSEPFSTKAVIEGTPKGRFISDITYNNTSEPSSEYLHSTESYVSGKDIIEHVLADKYLYIYELDTNNEIVSRFCKQLTKNDINYNSPFAGGDGSKENPYQIETAKQLSYVGAFSENPNTYEANNFILNNDIDLNVAPYNTGEGWTPIEDIAGIFDGNGKVIKNLMVNRPDEYRVGLFKRGGFEGIVKDLGIVDADVKGKSYVGILMGSMSETHIEKVYVTGKVTGGRKVGGLIGEVNNAVNTVINCYSRADVGGTDHVGGLVGFMSASSMKKSYTVGKVEIADQDKKESLVGGILGADNPYDGEWGLNTFVSNYYDSTISGRTDKIGGTGKNTQEMKTKDTFLTKNEEESWDFENVWAINANKNDGYPYLKVFDIGSTPEQPEKPSGRKRHHSSSSSSVVNSGTGVNVLVNGKAENAGSIETSKTEGKTTLTVCVDKEKIEKKLRTEGDKPIITIPISSKAEKVVAKLNADMVKNMEKKHATIEAKTKRVAYIIKADEINTKGILKKVGNKTDLKNVDVQIEISEPSKEITEIVKNSAEDGKLQLMVPAVEFNVNYTYNNKTYSIDNFNNYVERRIEIPSGVDPNKITTGIVVNPDGTTYHVPTYVKVIDGKYYAVINSLTNSIYTVVWHPIEFKDVEKHWAKDAVNNMGSRMVVNGAGNDMYLPNKDVTRAEFAAIMVRALGLKAGMGENKFGDIKASDWYCDYVETATNYNIIKGYDNGSFGPNDKITREQAMTMIARAMTLTTLESNLDDGETDTLINSFTDGTISAAYAKSNIAACLKTGIVFGKNGNIIAPKDNITRAEVAVIVERLLQKSELIDK